MSTKDINTEPAAIGYNRSDRAGTKLRQVALEHIVIWAPAQAEVDDLIESDLQDEIEVLKTSGQRHPAIGRELEGGRIEVVARARVVEAVRRHSHANPDDTRGVEVSVYRLSDEQAFRFLAQDIDAGPDWSSLARGRIFLSAVEELGGVTEAARACRVSKAAVSKNLDVARCIPVIGDKVEVHRDIAQRPATWLMGLVGREPDGSDAPSREVRTAVLDAIAKMDIAPAKQVFAALSREIEPKPARRKDVTAIIHEGVEVGTIARKKSGPIRIELTNAGEVELDVLVRLLKKAIATTRT